MLDKASEVYHSGIVNRDAQKKFGALVVTEEGIEVMAATDGLRFEYAGRWSEIFKRWAEIDRRVKNRQERAQLQSAN